MKNNHYTILISSLVVLFLASCDSSVSEPSAAMPLADDVNGQTSQLLMTGVADNDLENSWFCTFTSDSTYLDRKEMRFLENGAALVDGVEGSWSVNDSGLYVEFANESNQFENIVFSRRVSNSDVFNASSTDALEISCDWSGPPRNQDVQNDGFNITDIEEITGDTIDILLSNGRVGSGNNSHWLCQFDSLSGSDFELFLFDDGTMRSTAEGRWSRRSATSIELIVNGAAELWTDVEIELNGPEGSYNAFAAISEFNGPVACNWAGTPRVTAWIGEE